MSASDDGLHVWGPSVATLDVHDLDHPGGARLVAMTRDATGTWHTPHRPAGRYWLVVDGIDDQYGIGGYYLEFDLQ